jgi:hypothetical protein
MPIIVLCITMQKDYFSRKKGNFLFWRNYYFYYRVKMSFKNKVCSLLLFKFVFNITSKIINLLKKINLHNPVPPSSLQYFKTLRWNFLSLLGAPAVTFKLTLSVFIYRKLFKMVDKRRDISKY